jgi:hypothetical protein
MVLIMLTTPFLMVPLPTGASRWTRPAVAPSDKCFHSSDIVLRISQVDL